MPFCLQMCQNYFLYIFIPVLALYVYPEPNYHRVKLKKKLSIRVLPVCGARELLTNKDCWFRISLENHNYHVYYHLVMRLQVKWQSKNVRALHKSLCNEISDSFLCQAYLRTKQQCKRLETSFSAARGSVRGGGDCGTHIATGNGNSSTRGLLRK
jgi:hypothetical protein